MRTALLILLLAVTCIGQSGLRSPAFVASLRQASAASAPTPDILWWKLNEGSGTAITGTGSNGGDGGAADAAWVTGKSGSGSALDFNGTTNDAATSAAITYGVNVITFCSWVWMDDDTTTQVICESSVNAGLTPYAPLIFISSGLIRCYNGGLTGVREESVAGVTTGVWFHMLVVLDGSTATGDVKIYLNGTLQTESINQDTRTGTGNIAANTLYVGARALGSLFYNGRLDDVRIYSGDKSSSVAAIMADPQ